MQSTTSLLVLMGVAATVGSAPAGAQTPGSPASDLRVLQVGDISMRVAERGEGPLVLLLHGFPESWYSYRHQLQALAEAGYTAVAPDLRGYGGSDVPPAVEDYAIDDQCADVTGLMDAYGEDRAVVVGHDWGALIAWQCAALAPERVRAVVGMSVPYSRRGEVAPTVGWRRAFGDNFFYILYFQEPGVAEAELDADPRTLLRRLYASPDTPRGAPRITDPLAAAGGWIGRLGEPTAPSAWLTAADLDYYVDEFARVGFRGGLNFYRNFDRNWELLADVDPVLPMPALFIAGEQDGVIGGATRAQLQDRMAPLLPDLRGVHLIPGSGHWTQQEKPTEVNRLLLEFLAGL